MATQEFNIINHLTVPDPGIYPTQVKNELVAPLTNASGEENCIVMSEVATDSGINGSFKVPRDYVGSPVLKIQGILDGALSGTLAFGMALIGKADTEAYDTALEGADLADNGGTWTGYSDEDIYEESITLTVTLAAGDDVQYKFFIDDSVNSFAGNFLLRSLVLEYSDA